jgi:hypothetical protein
MAKMIPYCFVMAALFLSACASNGRGPNTYTSTELFDDFVGYVQRGDDRASLAGRKFLSLNIGDRELVAIVEKRSRYRGSAWANILKVGQTKSGAIGVLSTKVANRVAIARSRLGRGR